MKKIFILGLLLIFNLISAQTAQTPEDIKNQTRKTVETFFKYFDEKDPERIASVVAENVDWYIFESKKFPWTGKRTKRSEIPAVFKTLFSYFNEGKDVVKPESFMVDGNEAAVFLVLGREFKSSGKSFSMLVAIHFKVENGLITKFCLYEQTPILEKAFEK
ncbi:nuclear transport factor 2 family protein [Flavobacterium sp. MC2016-06]|jgi:ketosteroid isomerase-like protein|uniref:nuclear transport factor 2 family protein n=1 Tax=Flavobacterium sp. MC2016-06 TaxID=2676308 RepID=UPI0012BAD2D5|nr:nuclear transport factor 2 family protein [Flavobacterium sp. MC2016-06]MBU3862331.1 nuclear transport factor 2 family protein [Flavobacterium sp. MC2016-06]